MLEGVDEELSQVPEQEKAHARRLLKRIKSFDQSLKERAKGWKKARQYVNGDVEGDDGEGLVRVNLVTSVLETIQPNIYAKAPEIAVYPDERLNTKDYGYLKPFSETLQIALNTYLVKEAKLKQRGKSAVRAALTTTTAWVKVIYQTDYQEDPVIRNRMNDTQDNIAKLQSLIKETKSEGGKCDLYEAKLYELEQQITAMQGQLEVKLREGLVLDIVPVEDLIVMDNSIRDVDEFLNAGCIVHKIEMTVGKFKARFKADIPKGARKYVSKIEGGEDVKSSDVDEDDYLVCVFEAWSLDDMTVYTMIEGFEGYIKPPYQPPRLGEQWYPFFPLQLRRVDGVRYPLSTVEMLCELQDEYNTRRTSAAEHRKKNIPVRLLNKASGITDEEVTEIVNRTISKDVIGVTVNVNESMQSQMGALPEIPYNQAMYDTSDILFDMEKVSSAQDAASGAIRVAKTATEAEIAASGMQGRIGENVDIIEDWLTSIANYSAQLLLQHVSAETIQQKFGETAVWPELTKEQLFGMVHVVIRAGSTSKPNKMRERDQWIQLLPLMENALERLMAAKQSGQDDVANVIVSLLDETLKRFDERLDAKELLGIDEEEEGEEGQPEIPPEVMQQIEQMQQQFQQVQEQMQMLAQENDDLKKGHDLKEREVAVKEALAQHQMRKDGAEVQATELANAEKTIHVAGAMQLLQENIDANQGVMQAVADVVNKVELLTQPRKKVAKAVRQPDGSFVMEAIEEINGQQVTRTATAVPQPDGSYLMQSEG